MHPSRHALVHRSSLASVIALAEPDEGHREVHRRGNQTLIVRDSAFEGFSSVRLETAVGGAYPSDKLSYFGADAVPAERPRLADAELPTLAPDVLERYDLDGDGRLSHADVDEFDLFAELIAEAQTDDLDDPDREVPAELVAATDLDGDGIPATDADRADLVETVGSAVIEGWLATTPAEC